MIRAARPLDAGAVGALLTDGARGFDWMPRLHSAAEDIAHAGVMISRGWVHVALADGRIAGFLAREERMIHALYVAPAQRGQGIGSALLEFAKSQVRRLELWTFQANSGAQRFYERHGFNQAARTDGAGNDEHLPDIFYVWQEEKDDEA